MDRPVALNDSQRDASTGSVAATVVMAPSRRLVEYFVIVSSAPVTATEKDHPNDADTDTNAKQMQNSPPSNESGGSSRIRTSSTGKPGHTPNASKQLPSKRSLSFGKLLRGSSMGKNSKNKRRSKRNVRSSSDTDVDRIAIVGDEKIKKSGQQTQSEPLYYKPEITARYPLEDHDDAPLNDAVASFCFSIIGDKVVPRTEFRLPKVHHFVLTDEQGKRFYGTCLTFYEECECMSRIGEAGNDEIISRSKKKKNLSPRRLMKKSGIGGSQKQDGTKRYLPQVLCIISSYPYLTAFREYLSQLWRLATTTNLMTAPIERYVLNICSEIPAPPAGAFELQMSILNSTIRFWSPPADQPIAYVALPFHLLFECLDIKNILFCWYSLALERRVLLISSEGSLLTVVAEILLSLLFPMSWSQAYIPLLPQEMSPILDAPFPYLCGVCAENINSFADDIGDETIVVDLDRNLVTPGPCTPQFPPIPEGRRQKLESALQKAAGDVFWSARDVTKREIAEAYYPGEKLSDRQVEACDYNKLMHFYKTGAKGKEKYSIQRPEDATMSESLAKIKRHGIAIWDQRLKSFDDAFNLACTPDSARKHEATSDDDQSTWDAVQEAFLMFYASALKNYRKYLVEPGTGGEGNNSEMSRWSQCAQFRAADFIADQRAEYQPFLTEFCSTQQFDEFVCKRRGLPAILFFDQTVDDKLNRTKRRFKAKVDTPFLVSAKAHKQLKQIKAVEPNRSDLPFDGPVDVDDLEIQKTFVYPSFPKKFDQDLFGMPRPIPGIVSAEFDRQAALLERLRVSYNYGDGTDEDMQVIANWDSSPSPERAVFGLYFSLFAPTIGLTLASCQAEQSRLAEEERNWTIPTTSSPSGIEISPDDGNGLFYPATLPSVRSRQNRLFRTETKREEAAQVARSQLDLAFDMLLMMKARDIPLSDRQIFRHLIDACGRCQDAKRARDILDMMSATGVSCDGELLMSYVSAFPPSPSTFAGSRRLASASGSASKTTDTPQTKKKGDEWDLFGSPSMKETQKRFSNMFKGSFFSDEESSETGPDDDSSRGVTSEVSDSSKGEDDKPKAPSIPTSTREKKDHHRVFSPLRDRKKEKLRKKSELCVTDPIQQQVVLGESLLEYLYPGIDIDVSSEACPSCSTILTEDNIIGGWRCLELRDHSTQCPKCNARFVPKFSVSSSSPSFEGSQGRNTPLYCEYLSPWVVRYLVHNAIEREERGFDAILDKDWRCSGINATLWWNLVAHFIRFRLPLTLLLQGSFPNCLVTPSPDHIDS